jgi:hypothetical protein
MRWERTSAPSIQSVCDGSPGTGSSASPRSCSAPESTHGYESVRRSGSIVRRIRARKSVRWFRNSRCHAAGETGRACSRRHKAERHSTRHCSNSRT